MTVNIPVKKLRKVKMFVICLENSWDLALSHFGGAFRTSGENLTAVTDAFFGFFYCPSGKIEEK